MRFSSCRCNERKRLYTCPRCGIGYCGVECYKSDAHTDCSESFYKQCVEEDLKSQENDPVARQKMMEILKRVHEADLENDILDEDSDEKSSSDEEDYPLDSDDEQEVIKDASETLWLDKCSFLTNVYLFQLLDLETRLQNVNFEDPNELWSALSEAERQEFEALIKNGEAEKLLPKWVPWWTCRVERKLIYPVEEDIMNAYSDLKYPAVIDVPLFNELQVGDKNKFICAQDNIIKIVQLNNIILHILESIPFPTL